MRKHRFEGKWWIPDNPEKRYYGTLTFTPIEGSNLNLIGTFGDIKDLTKPLDYEVILGTTQDIKGVTLHNCLRTHADFESESYHANLVFVGALFQKTEDIKFKSLSVNYSHLDEWAEISGFDIQDRIKNGETTIKYMQPAQIEANTGDGHKTIISTRSILQRRLLGQQEASIKQETYVKIEFPEQRSYADCFDDMYHIQNFLTLCTMQPVQPLSIEGITESNVETVLGKPHHPPVEIYYKSIDISSVSKLVPSFNMLFTLKQLDFKTMIENWFKKKKFLQPVYDIFFGTFYNPHMYLQHKFLSLVQGLESYHRRVIRNNVLSEEEHAARIKDILNSIPERYQNWLTYRLEHSNEPSLPERLIELLDKYSEIRDFCIKDKDAFVRKVTDTRNYLTHYDTKLRDKAAEWPELYHISQRLKIILTACLLEQMGVASDMIEPTLIEKSKLFNVDSM